MRALLAGLRPDRIEVSDRLTLRGMGQWAADHAVPSVVISHERLDRLLNQFLLPDLAARWVADWANRRMAGSYDTVVCTTRFAREEFDRIGSRNVVQVPLGVDLVTFAPSHRAGQPCNGARPGYQSPSSDSYPGAAMWPSCSPRPIYHSHRDHTRRSDWRRWRR